jgi:hypothetical protein
MLRYPALEPVAVGAKVTLTVHVAPTANGEDETQLSVSEKSPEVPTRVTRKLGLLLVLVRVRVCGPLAVPMFCVPKESEVSEGVTGAAVTKTGTPLLGPPEYVVTTVACPGATALTSPLVLTVTMAGLDEEKDK